MNELLTQEESSLTPKDLLFIKLYLSNGMNATQAAKDCGFSEASAYELGHRVLKKVEVKKILDQYLKNESLEAQELIKRLSDVAKNRGMEYLNDDATIDLAAIKANGLTHLIKSVRKGKNGRIHVTFYDATRAMETIAKILKLTTDGVSVMVNIDERINTERQLTEELMRIHDKLMQDPLEQQVDEYRQQLINQTRNKQHASNNHR